MKTIEIYGASDDLIEIDGDICEEFNPISDETSYIACSDGTLLTVEYTRQGYWRINRIQEGTAKYSKVEGKNVDDDYSDTVTLEGEISWVMMGRDYARA